MFCTIFKPNPKRKVAKRNDDRMCRVLRNLLAWNCWRHYVCGTLWLSNRSQVLPHWENLGRSLSKFVQSTLFQFTHLFGLISG